MTSRNSIDTAPIVRLSSDLVIQRAEAAVRQNTSIANTNSNQRSAHLAEWAHTGEKIEDELELDTNTALHEVTSTPPSPRQQPARASGLCRRRCRRGTCIATRAGRGVRRACQLCQRCLHTRAPPTAATTAPTPTHSGSGIRRQRRRRRHGCEPQLRVRL